MTIVARTAKAASAALGILMASVATPGFAVVIDDFSVGQIHVTANTPVDQTGLDPAHVLGGSRRIAIGQYGSGSELEVTADGQLVLSSTGWGYHTVTYGAATPLGGVDLTAGGHDRVRLTLGDVGAGFHPLGLYVNLPTNSSSNGVGLYIQEVWDGVILEFPYTSFPVSFSSVETITLNSFRNPGSAYAIDSIVTAGHSDPADFNRDGVVNADDLATWKQAFGITTSVNQYRPVFASADANRDGRVDGRDLLIWQRSLSAVPSATATPEPACGWLALAALAAGGAIARRRD